jgi:hypothetical protein
MKRASNLRSKLPRHLLSRLYGYLRRYLPFIATLHYYPMKSITLAVAMTTVASAITLQDLIDAGATDKPLAGDTVTIVPFTDIDTIYSDDNSESIEAVEAYGAPMNSCVRMP